MKNPFKLFGIIALTAIIWFSMTACGGNNGGGGDGSPATPPIVNLTPAAIPSSDNPAFTNPGVGGQSTVTASDMDEVLELLMPAFWAGTGFLFDDALDYIEGNLDGAGFAIQLQNVPFSLPLTDAGISGLQGRFSAFGVPPSFSASFNNVNYVYRSYQATHQWFLAPHGRTVVASARWSYTVRGWESGSFLYFEEGVSASFAAAFQTLDMYGRAVVNFGFVIRDRETADGDWDIDSETAYAVVYLFDSNNTQVHRYQAATVERAFEIIWEWDDWNGYSAPIGADAGLELPSGASRWLRARR